MTNVNDAPVITSGNSNNVTQGNVYEYQVTATDSDAGDTLTCEFVGDHPEWLSIDTSSSSGNVVATITSTTAVGNDKVRGDPYEYTIKVEDTSGATATKTLSFNVINENDPPAFVDGVTHTITILEDEPYQHLIQVTDPDTGNISTITLVENDSDLPATLVDNNNNTATLTLQPGNQLTNTNHTYKIKADDGNDGVEEQILTVIVSAYNNAPIFSSIPNSGIFEITEGNAATFDIEMEDKDHEVLTIAAVRNDAADLPEWFSISIPAKVGTTNTFRSTVLCWH